MSEFTQIIDDFQGVAKDADPGKLAPHLFQTDEGGDLFFRGSWRLRRGQSRLLLDPMSGPIRTFFTFETPSGSISTVVVDDNGVFRGYAQLQASGAPTTEPDLEGFDVGGMGEGGFDE